MPLLAVNTFFVREFYCSQYDNLRSDDQGNRLFSSFTPLVFWLLTFRDILLFLSASPRDSTVRIEETKAKTPGIVSCWSTKDRALPWRKGGDRLRQRGVCGFSSQVTETYSWDLWCVGVYREAAWPPRWLPPIPTCGCPWSGRSLPWRDFVQSRSTAEVMDVTFVVWPQRPWLPDRRLSLCPSSCLVWWHRLPH